MTYDLKGPYLTSVTAGADNPPAGQDNVGRFL